MNHHGASRRVLRQTGYDERETKFAYKVTGACVTHVDNPTCAAKAPTRPSVDSWDNH